MIIIIICRKVWRTLLESLNDLIAGNNLVRDLGTCPQDLGEFRKAQSFG